MTMDLSNILAMSGYGIYVWTAFFVTISVMISFYCGCRVRLKKALMTYQRLTTKEK